MVTTPHSEANLDEFILNQIAEREVLLNQFMGRSGYVNQQSSGRDINKECDYQETSNITAELLKDMYDREPVATRVVQLLPKESWSVVPDVFEDDDPEHSTPFESSWNDLSVALAGNSKYKTKGEGNPIWEYLQRVDELSGIGFFGVLFMGFSDGEALEKEVKRQDGLKLNFLRAFDQSSVNITSFETNKNDPRYGMPKMYQINFANPSGSGGTGVQIETANVHWSRVIHVADNLGSNEIYGVPRQRPVWNRLLDLRKLYAGSAEMYWKGAFPGISIETHPSLGANPNVDNENLKKAVENYQLGLKRYLAVNGFSAKSLAPQVVDPSPQIDTQIDAICIQLATPKRIFTGSERGELASSQDRDAWNARLSARQGRYITPRIIVPFIDRLVALKVLEEPQEYRIEWPALDAQTAEEKATIAIKEVHALTKYVAGDVDGIMSPIDFYTRILGYSDEDATQILERAIESFEDAEERDLSREIMEAKALRRAKPMALSDADRQKLYLSDESKETVKDALSDKFTESAEGNKSLRSLTSTRVSDADDESIEDLEDSLL